MLGTAVAAITTFRRGHGAPRTGVPTARSVSRAGACGPVFVVFARKNVCELGLVAFGAALTRFDGFSRPCWYVIVGLRAPHHARARRLSAAAQARPAFRELQWTDRREQHFPTRVRRAAFLPLRSSLATSAVPRRSERCADSSALLIVLGAGLSPWGCVYSIPRRPRRRSVTVSCRVFATRASHRCASCATARRVVLGVLGSGIDLPDLRSSVGSFFRACASRARRGPLRRHHGRASSTGSGARREHGFRGAARARVPGRGASTGPGARREHGSRGAADPGARRRVGEAGAVLVPPRVALLAACARGVRAGIELRGGGAGRVLRTGDVPPPAVDGRTQHNMKGTKTTVHVRGVRRGNGL